MADKQQEDSSAPAIRLHPAAFVALVLAAGAAIAVWVLAPPLRPLLLTLAAMLGLVGIYPLAYLAYVGFSANAQRERLRDDFRLLGLVQEDELNNTVDKLYQTVYSPIQFVTYIGLIVLVSLLVLHGYLQRQALGFIPPETMSLVMYAFLGAYVFSVQELIRRYNTFDLQPQVYSSILVRTLVAVVITAAGAAVINLSGGQLASGDSPTAADPQAWAAVVAFAIGAFPSRGLRWLTQQADKVMNQAAPAESELPLLNLLGLNAWHEARLSQMGLDDAQNLATVDIRRMLLTTQFDTQQIVHWIDQSILYVKVGTKLQRYRDAKLSTFHEFREAVAGLSLHPREQLSAEALAERVEARKRLAATLGMTDADELERLGDTANFPNYIHIAEYYARTSQVVRQRASLGMDLLTGALKETDYDRAVETGEQLLDQNPKDAELHKRLGYAYYQLSLSAPGERRVQLQTQALNAYSEAIRLDPQMAPAYYNRSLVYVARAEYAAAVKDCTSAIAIDGRNAEAYNNRGLAYLKLDYLDRALIDLDEALRLDDRLGVAYLNRGVAYNSRGQFDKAAHDFEHAYLLSVRPAELWIAWGIALNGQQNYLGAVDKLSYAVQYDENAALAYAQRGYAYLQLGPESYRQAQLDLEAAMAKDASLLDARVNYGLLMSRQRRYDTAIEQYQQVLQANNPKYELVTRYNLTAAYRQLGKLDEARAQFEIIMKIAPPDSVEYADARRFLGRSGPGSGTAAQEGQR